MTATCACLSSVPVAKALGSSSGMIQIFGRETPEATAISSTTFTSCCSSGLEGDTNSHAPVDHSTCFGPLRHAKKVTMTAIVVVTSPIHGIVW